MIKLGVNIDHVATLREARKTTEPDPIFAVNEAHLGGADSITIHLREDERHIHYRDAKLIREVIPSKLNLEMSINEEVVKKALKILPHQITIVPERREELTTEAGLDIKKNYSKIEKVIKLVKKKNIIVSLFIDTDEESIRLSKKLGADYVEIHTGNYANAKTEKQRKKEFEKIKKAAEICKEINLGFNAGHGLNYINIIPFLQIENLYEVNIGHSIISRAIFIGLRNAVREMKNILLQRE